MQQRSIRVVKKQEAVRVGRLIVIAQPDQVLLHSEEQRVRKKGYRVSETAHFLVCQKPDSSQVILMHRYEQGTIDADLIRLIEEELFPYGFTASAKEFGATLFAILASTFPSPRDQRTIWKRFCINSFEKLCDQLLHPLLSFPSVSYIAPFAAIYRRVLELSIGRKFLDVGCSFGFLPAMIAKQKPDSCIIGCDISSDALRFSTDLANEIGVRQTIFKRQDVLDESIGNLGIFDTVTAIHLLEHLPEEQLPIALQHLLQVTRHRLIVAVPYEAEATRAYGHEQVFTREKLEHWGKWCFESIGGVGQYWCEEVAGGLLVVDRIAIGGVPVADGHFPTLKL